MPVLKLLLLGGAKLPRRRPSKRLTGTLSLKLPFLIIGCGVADSENNEARLAIAASIGTKVLRVNALTDRHDFCMLLHAILHVLLPIMVALTGRVAQGVDGLRRDVGTVVGLRVAREVVVALVRPRAANLRAIGVRQSWCEPDPLLVCLWWLERAGEWVFRALSSCIRIWSPRPLRSDSSAARAARRVRWGMSSPPRKLPIGLQ